MFVLCLSPVRIGKLKRRKPEDGQVVFFFFFFHVKDRLLTFTDVSDEVDVIADFLDSS